MTTTPSAIRDRAITVVAALTPASDSGVGFRAYRNEGGADFQAWAEANPASCRRRFQIRTTGGTSTPLVSNTDEEEHQVTLTVLVAYPTTGRDGAAQALDRDDVMDADEFQIDVALGMLGRANFSGSYPDACWIEGAPMDRIDGASVTFIELRYTYIYRRVRIVMAAPVVPPAATWTSDTLSSKGVPVDDTEWSAVLADAGVTSGGPTSIYTFQEASGQILDVNLAHDLLNLNNCRYSQPITGWTRVGAGHAYVASDNGFVKQHGTLPDNTTNSYMMLGYVALASTPSADAGIMSLADNAFFVGVTATDALLTTGTSTTGSHAMPVDSVVPVLFKTDITNNVFKVYTPNEILNRYYAAMTVNTPEVDFGVAAASSLYAADADYLYGSLWIGTGAEMTDDDVGKMLVSLGWTVPWVGTPTADATSSKFYPLSTSQWTALGITPPMSAWGFQETAALTVPDYINRITLDKTGGNYLSIGHSAAVPGQTRLATSFADGVVQQDLHSSDTRLPDLSTTSCAMLCTTYVTAATPAGGGFAPYQCWMYGFGVSQLCSAHVSATGVYGITVNGAGQFEGIVAQLNTNVTGLLVYDVTGSRVMLYTPAEKITGTFANQGATTGLHVGTQNPDIPAPAMKVSHAAFWSGADAEFSDAEARSMLQALGHTVAW